MATYDIHDIAKLFPTMPPHEYQRLEGSIKEQGLLEPILLFEGKIIDGRHRYRACCALGIDGVFNAFEGDHEDAVARTLALNFHRRHLTTVQRAALGVGLKQFEERRAAMSTKPAAKPAEPVAPPVKPAFIEKASITPAKAVDEARAAAAAAEALAETVDAELAKPTPASEEAPLPVETPAKPTPTPEVLAGERLGVSPRTIREAERIKSSAPDVFERMLTDVAGSMSDARRVSKMPKPTREKIHRVVDGGASIKEAIKTVVPSPVKKDPEHAIKLRGQISLSADEARLWSDACARAELTEKQAIEAAIRAWIKGQQASDS